MPLLCHVLQEGKMEAEEDGSKLKDSTRREVLGELQEGETSISVR